MAYSKKVECKECNKLFASESRLKLHLNSHKVEPCVCEFCDESFSNRVDLSKHIRSLHKVSYSCKFCGHMLNNQRQYERHLKKSHEDEYPGMYTHKIRKYDFVCRYCQEPQATYKDLKVHTLKHKENEEMDFEADNLKELSQSGQNEENGKEDLDVKEEDGPDNKIDNKDFDELEEVGEDLISRFNGGGVDDIHNAKVDQQQNDDFDVENLSNADLR